MTTYTDHHDAQHPVLVRDLVVGAVTLTLLGGLLFLLAVVAKAAVEILGGIALG